MARHSIRRNNRVKVSTLWTPNPSDSLNWIIRRLTSKVRPQIQVPTHELVTRVTESSYYTGDGWSLLRPILTSVFSTRSRYLGPPSTLRKDPPSHRSEYEPETSVCWTQVWLGTLEPVRRIGTPGSKDRTFHLCCQCGRGVSTRRPSLLTCVLDHS